MMHNLVAVQEYNTNMSGLWFGCNLHGYNSLSTDSGLRRARWLHYNDWLCASPFISSFCGSVTRPPISSIPNLDLAICILTKSLQTYPDPHKTTSTSSPSFPPTQPFFKYKIFLYHTEIFHGDPYMCNSLGLPQTAYLQAFALIKAIDSFSFGLAPTLFDVCVAAESSRSKNKLFEIVVI